MRPCISKSQKASPFNNKNLGHLIEETENIFLIKLSSILLNGGSYLASQLLLYQKAQRWYNLLKQCDLLTILDSTKWSRFWRLCVTLSPPCKAKWRKRTGQNLQVILFDKHFRPFYLGARTVDLLLSRWTDIITGSLNCGKSLQNAKKLCP